MTGPQRFTNRGDLHDHTRQNEREFPFWEDLPEGGRRYWRDSQGKVSGFQRIIKIVDAAENTVQVIQEIYDDDDELVEYHQKYPEDTGHQVLRPCEDAADKPESRP